MRHLRPIWLLTATLSVACASITGVGPSPSGPAATTVVPAASVVPGVSVVPAASVVPGVSVAPGESVVASAASDSPSPAKTPKPRKTPKPTPRATATPPKTEVDLSIYVETPDIPNPWYSDTDYTIPIHVVTAVADVPDAHAKTNIGPLVMDFDTGPIATTDTYSHPVTYNLPDAGPYVLTLSVKVPSGYADINRSNNKVDITIMVLQKP
jgi:hypothetical protein